MSTIFSTKDVDSLARALVLQYNALHDATVSASTDGYHRDISGVAGGTYEYPTSTPLQVTAATASSLSTTITLALNLKGVLSMHWLDDSAHLIADTVSDLTEFVIDNTSAGTQLSSVIEMLNAEKLYHNSHLEAVGVHLKDDVHNACSTTDASNLATAQTLANDMKALVNSHILNGPSCGRIKLL